MSQRRAYKKPEKSVQERLRKEWVSLDGGDVCCWGLTALEMISLGERSQRPAIDPRGGTDPRMASAWLIALATHTSDEPDAPRVWDDMNFEDILELTSWEFTDLTEAIARVMGRAPSEIETLEDFTAAPEGPNTSESTPSASNISTDSRRKSTALTTS
jgi:hypothetical protein